MEAGRKPTIKDICKNTGLALGTVSKYLNGGNIREENREKIDRAIEELHYTVDEYARGLITKRTRTVGILLPRFDNQFYAKLVSDIQLELSKYGYSAIARETNYDLEAELESISWFVSRRVDALIVVPNGSKAEDYAQLERLSVPVVFLDMFVPGVKCDTIVVNNRDISKRGVSYLLERGHRDIAILCLGKWYYTAAERLAGYREAYEEYGLPVNEELIYCVDETIDTAYDTVKQILRGGKCTAVYASNYTSTFGAVFAFNELGVKVPEQISFLGFDDLMITKLYRPKPAVINQPLAAIAATAAARAMELVGQEEYVYRINYLDCEFITGDTVAELAGS